MDALSETSHGLRVKPSKPIAFLPGQYVNIGVPGTDRHRSYSFSSAAIWDKGPEVSLPRRVIIGTAPGASWSAGRIDARQTTFSTVRSRPSNSAVSEAFNPSMA